MVDLVDYKEAIGWLSGASIGVVWIAFGLLYGMIDYWNGRVFLVVVLALTILLGTSSGGFVALSKNKNNSKEVIGWLLGASIGVVWIAFGLLYGMMDYWNGRVLLVVALTLTILLGASSGGIIALDKKTTK